MTDSSVCQSVTVDVASDKMIAVLTLPAARSSGDLSESQCTQALREAGVQLTKPLIERVRQALQAYQAGSDQPIEVRVDGRPPVPGENARLEWDASCQIDEAFSQGGDDNPGKVDHYNRSSFVTVKAGQTLGRLVPATPGEDGHDVCGKLLPAKPGRDLKITCNDLVLRDASGCFKAAHSGVLKFDGKHIQIITCLKVDGYVDFATGNILFDGEVEIAKGIRDCFQVKATGDVTVRGLIEAATIHTGGNLFAHGGMASKERGFVQVHGDLHAPYLDNVQGAVRGDLIVKSEIIQCELVVNGALRMPRGSVLGGKLEVLGGAEVQQLGSPAAAATALRLGAGSKMLQTLHQARASLEHMNQRLEQMEDELDNLKRAGAGRTASQREELTVLMFDISELAGKRKTLQAKYEQLRQHADERCKVELSVGGVLLSGVSIVIGDQKFIFNDDVKGPLWIGYNERGTKLIAKLPSDSSGVPLQQLARMVEL